ncbi:MAG: NAD(P)H-dependent oxidoreductase [Sulfuricurvum sp.]|uniref:NADPH-dependent FMN reductase n=1 Tax=Sulfuricurvum sp. TaxID=2025608 RepID=UPI00260F58FE|nr:NAD(P)H-dependent oxidoreductase [Sulfuricurvum sp.]MDD2830339.1 NAD(P)H-dependent oxidoreductase [Sulfuricurvum sp.]MDD4950790.1 NAD(P)H-dependent oxidoreductase [Sulfuricurvum sp.]
MKVIAFAASSSKYSINKMLVTYVAGLLQNCEVEILDLNDYELPLFSVDRENELGHPDLAKAFFNKIGQSDALIISFAEHNGSYTAAYKSLFDWCSRIDSKVFQNKPMFLLSTSPGSRGGATVLATASASAQFFGGHVKASISVPSFNQNFDLETERIINPEINIQIVNTLHTFIESINT